jgi:hypothetical protein
MHWQHADAHCHPTHRLPMVHLNDSNRHPSETELFQFARDWESDSSLIVGFATHHGWSTAGVGQRVPCRSRTLTAGVWYRWSAWVVPRPIQMTVKLIEKAGEKRIIGEDAIRDQKRTLNRILFDGNHCTAFSTAGGPFSV